MRIVFAGTPEVALPPLDALLASRHEVVAVLTRPDAPTGRGKRLTPSPVAARAAELGLETLTPRRPREDDFVARLTEIAPDCCPVVAYGALLPQRVLDVPPAGFVNLHFSVLPAWRGAAPVQHAIMAGDTSTGATTFRLVLELDAGPVYGVLEEPILPTDTAGSLLDRLSVRGADLLVQTLDAIEAGAEPHPQPDGPVTYAAKIEVEDARIDWARPAEVVDRRIRGCSPAPGAWTTLDGQRLKVLRSSLSGGSLPEGARSGHALPPGALEVSRRAVRVGTGTTAVELLEVQAPGKRPMTAADWARGVAFATEPRLGT